MNKQKVSVVARRLQKSFESLVSSPEQWPTDPAAGFRAFWDEQF